MKIAFVIERIEPWRGGAETSTAEMARLMSERGHEVHIVTSTTAPSPPNICIHRIPARAMLRPLRTASFIRRAGPFLRGADFDVVHAIVPLPTADVYQPRGGLLAETLERNVATRSSRPRQVLKQALHALSVKKRTLLDLEREVFRPGGPVIVAVSDYVVRQCAQRYGAASPRVRMIFNGVHLAPTSPQQRRRARADLCAQYGLSQDALLLLFIAHNFRLKGLGPLIDAVARLHVSGFRRFHVLIAGRDNPVGYQRRIDAMGLRRHVLFAGPSQRIGVYYQAADILVHPTYYDPCSRVVLEALSQGLPCITTAFNGAAEVITDGVEGFVIDSPENVGLLARRIEQLADGELRSRMSERALALRDRIGMSRHIDELEALFVEIVDRKKQGLQPVAATDPTTDR